MFPIVGTCALLLLPRSGLVQYMFCDTEFFCDADIACSPEGTTSAMGLGCVKTPWRKHSRSATSGGGPRAVILVTLAIFPSGRSPGADSSGLGRFCAGRWAQVCDDYALIAAMSGWMPIMFMTRVRL